jgi:hypothetical protein
MLALWNACPMKCNAYFIGAKPIPLGRHVYPACPTCPMECICNLYSIGVKPYYLFHRGYIFTLLNQFVSFV